MRDHPHSFFLTSCCNLRKFDYSCGTVGVNESHSVLTNLYQSCPLLEELVLHDLPSVVLGPALAGLRRHCTVLRTLSLCNCGLSTASLYDIAGMGSLRELSWECCRGLTKAGIAALAVLPLTALAIYGFNCWPYLDNDVEDLTEESLSLISGNVSRTLETLCIEFLHVDALESTQLATAIGACHKLKSLRASCQQRNHEFGLEGLQILATKCPLLSHVELKVPLAGCEYLATHCTHLKLCRSLLKNPYIMFRDELLTKYPHIRWRQA